ncbi:ATP-grasp fold amidoligase family protein [Salinispirillum marinum]|uniref:ATP-grasp fold amidoligase family protein n=2 Tax=Saccharospirillaceae TaxID=255527 RepID=A0ABV8BH77_9GAMM
MISNLGTRINIFLQNLENSIFAWLDRLLGFPIEKKKFKKLTGYSLDLKNPKSFNQKVCWKKIYDRNPLIPIVADKFTVRSYIADMLGKEEAEKILVPLYWHGEKAKDIPFDDLPDQFVLKCSHGSAMNIIVKDKSKFKKEDAIVKLNDWCIRRYGVRAHEWAYKNANPVVMVEEFLHDGSLGVPFDYKFHMIHGDCKFIQVDVGRFDNYYKNLYGKDWQKIDVKWNRDNGPDVEKPECLDEMLSIAEKLASPFDYVRVDFFTLSGRIFIGELTHYPVKGRAPFEPQSFDFELGEQWTLNR